MVKNRDFFILPLVFDAPVREVPVGAMPFGKEKLEWRCYSMVKKKFDDMFIRFDTTHERDRQTDTQTDTA